MAMQFCTHFVYGYAGIIPETFEIASLDIERDVKKGHMAAITGLKKRYPSTKFLLSVGGDKDVPDRLKYVRLLEAGRENRTVFIESVRDVIRSFKFDGLDLSFQLPRNIAARVESVVPLPYKTIPKLFVSDYIVDENADEHKEQFTELVEDLKTAFKPYDLMLTLTVLPNVNSSCKLRIFLHYQ